MILPVETLSADIVTLYATAVQHYGPIVAFSSLQHVIVAVERTGTNILTNLICDSLHSTITHYLRRNEDQFMKIPLVLMPTYLDRSMAGLTEGLHQTTQQVSYGLNSTKASVTYREHLFEYILSHFLLCMSPYITKTVPDATLRQLFIGEICDKRNKIAKGIGENANRYDMMDSVLLAFQVNQNNFIGCGDPARLETTVFRPI